MTALFPLFFETQLTAVCKFTSLLLPCGFGFLTLSGNFSYTETEYGEDYFVFTVDDPINPVPVFGTFTQGFVSAQVTDPAQASDYTVNLKGGPLKGIPEEKAI